MDLSIASAQMELDGLEVENFGDEDLLDDEKADEKEMEILNEVKTMMAKKRSLSKLMDLDSSKRVADQQIDLDSSKRVATCETPSPIIRDSRKRKSMMMEL